MEESTILDSGAQEQEVQATEPTRTEPTPTPESSGSADEDSFFDYRSISDKPELVAAYKQMQRAYTQKTQAIAADRKKLDLVKAYEADPINTIRAVAQQHGYTLTRAEAQQMAQDGVMDPRGNRDVQAAGHTGNWEPETWQEVEARISARTKQEMYRELAPVYDFVAQNKVQTIMTKLDSIDPDWRIYEDEIADTLRKYPTMENDLNLLYRTALPVEVQEGKNFKRAMSKLQAKTSASKVSGKGTVGRSTTPTGQKLTFWESVQVSRDQLQKTKGG